MKPYCSPIRTSAVSLRAEAARVTKIPKSPRKGRVLKGKPFTALCPQGSAMCGEPFQHDRVEDRRMLDIREMASVRDLLVARTRYERGDPLVLIGRRALIVGPADHQAGDPERRQARGEIEIQDRGGAAEEAARRRAGDGIADLRPAAWIARLEASGEPALHGTVGQGGERISLARGSDARRPSRLGVGEGGRQRVAQHQ